MEKTLFEINPDIDRAELARRFARDKRVQVRDFLKPDAAEEIRRILQAATPWGLAMQADGTAFDEPQQIRAEDMRSPEGQARAEAIGRATDQAAASGHYAFRYAQFSLVQAVQEGFAPGGPHELLLEHINAGDFLSLARDITGEADLVRADGQATLFARGQFLGLHIDSHVAEGWKIAYVMNFTAQEWKPDWGGYLQFFDDEGNITQGFMPRFNSLNLLRVPQPHSVSLVAPFAPIGRYAITGWLRDR